MTGRTRSLLFTLLAVPISLNLPDSTHAQGEQTGEEILAAAFANQYEVATTATIELVIRNAVGLERRRLFQAATKLIAGRLHSIGRLIAPDYLRGMTILQMETGDRGHDAFVYMPSLRAVRRVTTAQRGDALFGTDVTYEDLERRRVADYRILRVEDGRVGEEDTTRIFAEPRTHRNFFSVRFDVATTDSVLLETAYFKRSDDTPYRRVVADRASMQHAAGHTLPTHLVVENRDRGTSTEVLYRSLAIDPVVDDRLFSVRTLEQKGPIR